LLGAYFAVTFCNALLWLLVDLSVNAAENPTPPRKAMMQGPLKTVERHDWLLA
jgi:hypothetical protein